MKAAVQLIPIILAALAVVGGLYLQCEANKWVENVHFSKFIEQISSAMELISQTLNQMDLTHKSAQELENEVFNQATLAGLDKISLNSKIDGQYAMKDVYIQLEPSKNSVLDNYEKEWNTKICSLPCAMSPDCSGDYQNVYSPSYSTFATEIEDSAKKYDLFMKAMNAVEDEIDGVVSTIEKDGEEIRKSRKNLNQTFIGYDSAEETFREFQYSYYCSDDKKRMPEGKPPYEKLDSVGNILLSVHDNFWEYLTKTYTQDEQDWLYNRYTDAQGVLGNVEKAGEMIAEVEDFSFKVGNFTGCVKYGQEKELTGELEGEEYINECKKEAGDQKGFESDAELIKCYDGKIKYLKEGRCSTDWTKSRIEETRKIIEEAYSEGLNATTDKLPEYDRQVSLKELEIKSVLKQPGTSCQERVEDIEKDLSGIKDSIYQLVKDNLSPMAEAKFNNVTIKVQKADRILLWLAAKKVNMSATINTTDERTMLQNYEVYFVEGNLNERTAFGLIRKMIQDLTTADKGLDEKIEKLHDKVGEVIEPELNFIGTEKDWSIKAPVNEAADMRILLDFDELPDSTTITKTLMINHPLYKGTHKVEIEQTSYKLDTGKTDKTFGDYIPVRAVPITGEIKDEFTESRWNWLVLRKNINVTAIVPATLVIPLSFEPENRPFINSMNAKLETDKNILYIDMAEPGNYVLSVELRTSNPIEVGPSRCEAEYCTIQINNNIHEPLKITLLMDNQNVTSVHDLTTKEDITTQVTEFGVYFDLELPASGTILKLKTTTAPHIPVPDKAKVTQPATQQKEVIDFDSLYSKLESARRFYQAISKADEKQAKLVSVKKDVLSYLLSHTWTQIKDKKADAPQVADTTLSTIREEAKRVSEILYREVSRRRQLIEESKNLEQATQVTVSGDIVSEIDRVYGKPPENIGYPDANMTWVEGEVQELEKLQNGEDYTASIEKSLEILERIDAEPQPKVERYTRLKEEAAISIEEANNNGKLTKVAEDSYNNGNYADSYYQAKQAISEKGLVLPIWLGPVAILGIIVVCAYAFRERIDEAKQSVNKKIEKYKKKAEEDEMQKYEL